MRHTSNAPTNVRMQTRMTMHVQTCNKATKQAAIGQHAQAAPPKPMHSSVRVECLRALCPPSSPLLGIILKRTVPKQQNMSSSIEAKFHAQTPTHENNNSTLAATTSNLNCTSECLSHVSSGWLHPSQGLGSRMTRGAKNSTRSHLETVRPYTEHEPSRHWKTQACQ